MDRDKIISQMDELYTVQEKHLKEEAIKLEAINGSVMPKTYVGKAYGQNEFQGMKIPRILVFSINQSRRGQDDLSEEEVRQSMRGVKRDKQGRHLPNGFGPRALAANLCRWILIQCGVNEKQISPEDIHNLIAYDNFVKWPFNTNNSEPPTAAWPIFHDINRMAMGILEPQIILCLGKTPYDRLWEAVKNRDGYACESNVPGWAFSLVGPWGRCEFGACYHYSNPISPNRAWKKLRVDGEIPKNSMRLLASKKTEANELVQRIREIEKKPWWTDEYAGKAYTQYNPYQKFVAWHVCQTLTKRWIA